MQVYRGRLWWPTISFILLLAAFSAIMAGFDAHQIVRLAVLESEGKLAYPWAFFWRISSKMFILNLLSWLPLWAALLCFALSFYGRKGLSEKLAGTWKDESADSLEEVRQNAENRIMLVKSPILGYLVTVFTAILTAVVTAVFSGAIKGSSLIGQNGELLLFTLSSRFYLGLLLFLGAWAIHTLHWRPKIELEVANKILTKKLDRKDKREQHFCKRRPERDQALRLISGNWAKISIDALSKRFES